MDNDFFKNLKEEIIPNKDAVPTAAAAPAPNLPMEEIPIKSSDSNIRRAITNSESNKVFDVDEISLKLKEISEQSKAALEDLQNQSAKIIDMARKESNEVLEAARANYSIITKPSQGFVEPESDESEVEAEDLPQSSPQPQQRSLTDTILAYIP